MQKQMRLGVMLWAVLMIPVGGCTVALDAINPGIFQTFGIDPSYYYGEPGKIIIAFKNSTTSPAIFYAYTAVDAADLTTGINNVASQVEANGSRNEVFDCPLGRIGLGQVTAGAVNTLAVQVTGSAAAVSVAYTGAPLTAPDTLHCGDTIIVELTDIGNNQFGLSVQVQPAH